IVIFFILLAIFAPAIAKEGINEQNMVDRLKPPSKEFWLGTDDFGRDIFSRIVFGAQTALRIGFFAVIGFSIVGCFLGVIAGYYGRWGGTIIFRVFCIFLALP